MPMESFPAEDEMQKLIENEINQMEPNLQTFINERLIPLYQKTLKWEYGNDEEHPSWVFADLKERNVVCAYSLGGHGSYGDPWGIIFSNEDYYGMDAGWYSSLQSLLTDGWYE